MYLRILLLIHVAGAIAGIGPTFAYGIMGKRAQEAGPAALFIIKLMHEIQRKMVYPVVLFTQPVTGVLLIFASGRNNAFFSHWWLWVAILLYIGVLTLALGFNDPAVGRIIKFIEAGEIGTPDFMKSIKLAGTLGPIVGVMVSVIIVLMVLKPGG